MPNITAIVGVRDEVEFIKPCIKHLFGQGVSSIIVLDDGSIDGTTQILEASSWDGALEVLKVNNVSSNNGDYWVSGVVTARDKFNADWLLFQDADEFWLHSSNDLQDLVSKTEEDVLIVDRFNACLSDQNISHFVNMNSVVISELEIFVQHLILSANIMDEYPLIRWSSGKPAEKIIARAHSIEAVSAGAHGIIGAGGIPLPARKIQEAIIVHIPFSTFGRFRRKVQNIENLFELNPLVFSGSGGWHWKRWVKIFKDGGLDDEFAKQKLTESELAYLRSAGSICKADKMLSGFR